MIFCYRKNITYDASHEYNIENSEKGESSKLWELKAQKRLEGGPVKRELQTRERCEKNVPGSTHERIIAGLFLDATYGKVYIGKLVK